MSMRETGFDWKILNAVLQRGATKCDSASVMDCSEDTIDRAIKKDFGLTFKEYRERKMADTRIKLVEKAISKALAGDNTMLIFCLKNLCGWRDRQPDEENQPVVVNQYANLTDEQLESKKKELEQKKKEIAP